MPKVRPPVHLRPVPSWVGQAHKVRRQGMRQVKHQVLRFKMFLRRRTQRGVIVLILGRADVLDRRSGAGIPWAVQNLWTALVCALQVGGVRYSGAGCAPRPSWSTQGDCKEFSKTLWSGNCLTRGRLPSCLRLATLRYLPLILASWIL